MQQWVFEHTVDAVMFQGRHSAKMLFARLHVCVCVWGAVIMAAVVGEVQWFITEGQLVTVPGLPVLDPF